MQTFLPYPDFDKSAQCLDNRRLGKQRVECVQILNALNGAQSAWRHHPATKMWAGYEAALGQYLRAILLEWEKRKYKNNILIPAELSKDQYKLPPWLGKEEFHASHRSNLLRKSVYYEQFGWTEPKDLPYVWPVK